MVAVHDQFAARNVQRDAHIEGIALLLLTMRLLDADGSTSAVALRANDIPTADFTDWHDPLHRLILIAFCFTHAALP